MNHKLLILFLFTSILAQAQYPGGYAQYFNLSNAKNISGTYWSDLNQRSDGSIVARPSTGNYVRIFSNNSQPIYLGSSLKDINLYSVLGYDGEGEIFFGAPGKFLRLVGDSLQWDSTKPSQKWHYFFWLGKGSLMSGLPGQKFSLKYFDGTTYHPIKPPSHLMGILADSTIICPDLTTGNAAIGYKDTLGRLWVYQFDEESKTQQHIGTYPNASGFKIALVLGRDSMVVHASESGSMVVKNKIGRPEKGYYNYVFISSLRSSQILIHENEFFIRDIPERGYNPLRIYTATRPQSIVSDRFYNSYYIGNATEIMRIFPHITQYPNLFNNSNSNSINTLAQAADGTIYAGSYSTGLASITPKAMRSINTSMKFLNGGTCIGNDLFFFSENPSSLYKYSADRGFQNLWYDFNTGYMLTPTRNGNNMLAGLSGYSSFAYLDKKALSVGIVKMKKIGPEQGVETVNVLTLAEDPHGRIFFGRNSEGWGVYDASTGKANTFIMQKGQTAFGAMTSLCDVAGMVWMGGSKGLWVVDARRKNKIKPSSAIRINHPLLNDGHTIGSMKQWGKYLVLGAARNLLLLDLEAYHTRKEIRIRYLNPQETNFTSDCEQSTMLVDHRDSSLWMATTDNLYQFDLKTWLQQPVYLIQPSLKITVGDKQYVDKNGQSLSLSPTENSLHIEVAYQSPDNMPRYLQTAFFANGDTLQWTDAATGNAFAFLNLQPGTYTFHLRILQSDGTITTHSFPITIRRFLWQQWWFWLFISGVVIVYLFYLHKQKQLAEANAARIVAEVEALRSEQQRKLTAMQVKSLSTQFRPHFILNALNTIGAQLYDKPEVDAVLGQLGDSIGIIFRNAQAGSIAHPLSQEWRLVESVCSIKQMEFRHSIQIHHDIPPGMLTMENFLVPMGILQIPVENALVHGLRNKEEGPKDLWISMQQQPDNRINFTITDNGIGRKAAALISNYRRNGVGSKNLLAIIELLNQHNTAPISFSINDDVIEEDGKRLGTKVTISIPQNFQYDI